MEQVCSRVLVIVGLLLVGACASGDSAREDVSTSANESTFPPGTVGRAASSYPLTMERVRLWYAVIGDLHSVAENDPEFHVKVDFPLESQIQSQVTSIQASDTLSDVLRRHDLPPAEFVSLTVLIGLGWAWLRLAEGEEEYSTFSNVSPELLTFFQDNEAELKALQAGFTGPPN